AFTSQRRTPGRCADQKASRPLVGSSPDQVANTLKTEHRVINIEGQHGKIMDRITGARCHPRADGTRLVDALLKNLPVPGLVVAEDGADIFRLIALPHAGVDTKLLEQVGHTKSPRFVGDNG